LKSDDQVFFLTLIDFFVQIIFFGLFMYTVNLMAPSEASTETSPAPIARLSNHFGISDIVELTDKLTRLSPAQLSHAVNLYEREGSTEQVDARLELAKKLEEKQPENAKAGAGKPHCLSTSDLGNDMAIPLADVLAFEDNIAFVQPTEELNQVLKVLGLNFEKIRSLTLDEFQKSFSSIPYQWPNCMYTLRVWEQTRYTEPRDAIRRYFYPKLRKGTPPPSS